METLIATTRKRKLGYVGVVTCINSKNKKAIWRKILNIHRLSSSHAKNDALQKIYELKSQSLSINKTSS